MVTCETCGGSNVHNGNCKDCWDSEFEKLKAIPKLEIRKVTRFFADGKGFASLGALCNWVAKRQIGKEIAEAIEREQIPDRVCGGDSVTEALVRRYGLTWKETLGDYPHPSQSTHELWKREIAARSLVIRKVYESK